MANKDDFANINDLTSQGRVLRTMPANSDSVDWPRIPKALIITGAGNIAVTAVDGNYDNQTTPIEGVVTATSIVIPVTAGQIFTAVRIKRMWSTGTTATFVAVF